MLNGGFADCMVRSGVVPITLFYSKTSMKQVFNLTINLPSVVNFSEFTINMANYTIVLEISVVSIFISLNLNGFIYIK